METRGKSCSYHEWWTAPLKCTLNTYPLSVCWRFMFLNLKSGIYNEHSWTQTYTQHPPLITALTVCSVCIKSAFIVFFFVPPEKQVYGSIKLETGRSLEHRAGKKKNPSHFHKYQDFKEVGTFQCALQATGVNILSNYMGEMLNSPEGPEGPAEPHRVHLHHMYWNRCKVQLTSGTLECRLIHLVLGESPVSLQGLVLHPLGGATGSTGSSQRVSPGGTTRGRRRCSGLILATTSTSKTMILDQSPACWTHRTATRTASEHRLLRLSLALVKLSSRFRQTLLTCRPHHATTCVVTSSRYLPRSARHVKSRRKKKENGEDERRVQWQWVSAHIRKRNEGGKKLWGERKR